MVEKAAAYMQAHHMAGPGDHIIAGVSGGADSVCLFLVLEKLRHRMGFSMSVVHIEHGLRGEESLADMKFVNRLAERYKIPITCLAYPVREIAKKKKISLEEAGREVRYQAFAEEERRFLEAAKREGGTVKTAVAHHADDNAETLLFHMCRGSGIAGLAGICPVRGTIIRPLLCVTRKEIEDFLQKERQPYRRDVTNEDVCYTRNRIRKNIMPELAQVNERAVFHMNRLSEEAAELSAYLREETDKILKAHMTKEKGQVRYDLSEFMGYPSVLKSRLMLELAAEACGRRKDISREHIQALLHLIKGETGRKISLPYGVIAEKSYEVLYFYSEKKEKSAAKFLEVLIENYPVDIEIPTGVVRCRILEDTKKITEIPKNLYTKWMDYDKIKNRLYLRTRMPGDYFMIDRQGRRQKLKDYFINEKVPKQEREQLLLLAEGSHILWAIGYRISEYYKVTEQTKRVLEVQYVEGSNE